MTLVDESAQEKSNFKKKKFTAIINLNTQKKPSDQNKLSNNRQPLLQNDINTTLQNNEPTEIIRHVCCFQLKFTTKQPNMNYTDDKHGLPNSVKPIIMNFFWKSFISLLRTLFLVSIVCASFLSMTVFLKDFFKISKEGSFNETRSANETKSLGIEWCEYCYLRVWFTTSFLLFVYPIYILVYLVKSKIFKIKKCNQKTENDQLQRKENKV